MITKKNIMKKLLLSATVLTLFTFHHFNINAQTIVFEDDFTNIDGTWLVYDDDGDTEVFAYYTQTDSNVALGSQSYVNPPDGSPTGTPGTVLTPNNYVFTEIDLSSYNSGEEILLEWQALNWNSSFPENYSVYAFSETTANLSSGADISNAPGAITFSESISVTTFEDKSIDISSLGGNVIILAYRHHDSTDNFGFYIDNVKVSVIAPVLSTEEFEAAGFNLFVDDANTIQLSANETIQNIKLFNIQGQEVLNNTLNTKTASVGMDQLASGVYIAHIDLGYAQNSYKIIKK